MTEAAWRQGAQHRAPAHGQIDVWRVALDQPPSPALQQCLADAEKERAARFHFERDRRRFVAARVALRTLLGRALAIPPAAVHFQFGPQGKPFLHQTHRSDIHFNLAHSHNLALIALARATALGVDLEHARPLDQMQLIARRFFSVQEVAALAAAPPEHQHRLFFRIWSRKEAFIKATGKGLSQPLDAFDVLAAGGEPLPYVALQGQTTAWRLWDLDLGPVYGAALVAWSENQELTVRQFSYTRQT